MFIASARKPRAPICPQRIRTPLPRANLGMTNAVLRRLATARKNSAPLWINWRTRFGLSLQPYAW